MSEFRKASIKIKEAITTTRQAVALIQDYLQEDLHLMSSALERKMEAELALDRLLSLIHKIEDSYFKQINKPKKEED